MGCVSAIRCLVAQKGMSVPTAAITLLKGSIHPYTQILHCLGYICC
jgi:hypothetical protein